MPYIQLIEICPVWGGPSIILCEKAVRWGRFREIADSELQDLPSSRQGIEEATKDLSEGELECLHSVLGYVCLAYIHSPPATGMQLADLWQQLQRYTGMGKCFQDAIETTSLYLLISIYLGVAFLFLHLHPIHFSTHPSIRQPQDIPLNQVQCWAISFKSRSFHIFPFTPTSIFAFRLSNALPTFFRMSMNKMPMKRWTSWVALKAPSFAYPSGSACHGCRCHKPWDGDPCWTTLAACWTTGNASTQSGPWSLRTCGCFDASRAWWMKNGSSRHISSLRRRRLGRLRDCFCPWVGIRLESSWNDAEM